LKSRILFPATTAWLAATLAIAQHEGHAPAPTATPTPPPASSAPETAEHASHDMDHGATAPRLFQSDMLRMNGMLPENPSEGMAMPGWHVMDLGIARLAFNGQGGPSGRKGVESSNWNMLHVQHDLWGGRLSLMMMNSLEPATFPARGSPELFQTGETFEGEPIVDRQHPHDFFMNLSATWRRSVGESSAIWFQLAPVGDPALGPTAFMHRASAGENPTAPLGHHWEDSTHIAFDVITAGWGWKAVSIEGSAFHGAEPDEHRWGIESGEIDSASGRIWLRSRDGWSGQVSYGFLKNPEALEPGDLRRITASVSYGAAGEGPFAATLLWGRNDEEHGVSSAWLLEGAWQATALDQVYARAEYVEKDYALLAFKGHPHVPVPGLPEHANIFAFTAGYLRDFELVPDLATGLGADVTVYSFPASLKPVYGDFPVSGHFFMRLRWGTSHGSGHSM
jgi:hypothetical protein